MIEDLRTFVEQDNNTETETQVGKGDGTTEQTGVTSEQKKMEADEGSMNIDQPSSLFNAVISEINKRWFYFHNKQNTIKKAILYFNIFFSYVSSSTYFSSTNNLANLS